MIPESLLLTKVCKFVATDLEHFLSLTHQLKCIAILATLFQKSMFIFVISDINQVTQTKNSHQIYVCILLCFCQYGLQIQEGVNYLYR